MARFVRRCWPALLILLLLTGCRPTATAHELQFLAMDTFMHLTAYGDGGQVALVAVREDILLLDSLLAVTEETSEVYALNHRTDTTLTLSPELTALLEQALILARQTGGAFDPTVYPVVRAWGFTADTHQVPPQAQLDVLLPLVDHTKLTLNENTLTLPLDVQLDFGGIAKGWAGDRAAQLLRGRGVSSAIVRLGGNIHTIGTKPDGSLWNIGIEDPDSGATLGTVSVADLAVVTSGSYQRFFTVDGQTYHHIIDPATGYPAHSGLSSVTVIGKHGARCDALSTALFVMGLEQGTQFWREHRDFEAVFVDTNGNVSITAGLKDHFQLSEPNGRTVEVLQ